MPSGCTRIGLSPRSARAATCRGPSAGGLLWQHGQETADWDEDRSQVRTRNGPRVMASLRNLVLTILRLTGASSIAAALRHHARRPDRPLRTIMNC